MNSLLIQTFNTNVHVQTIDTWHQLLCTAQTNAVSKQNKKKDNVCDYVKKKQKHELKIKLILIHAQR